MPSPPLHRVLGTSLALCRGSRAAAFLAGGAFASLALAGASAGTGTGQGRARAMPSGSAPGEGGLASPSNWMLNCVLKYLDFLNLGEKYLKQGDPDQSFVLKRHVIVRLFV